MSKRTGKVIGPDDGFAVPLWGDAEPAQGAMFAAGVGIGPEAPRAAEVACAACGAVCGGSCGAMAVALALEPHRCRPEDAVPCRYCYGYACRVCWSEMPARVEVG